jgi:hypothetical protein
MFLQSGENHKKWLKPVQSNPKEEKPALARRELSEVLTEHAPIPSFRAPPERVSIASAHGCTPVREFRALAFHALANALPEGSVRNPG